MQRDLARLREENDSEITGGGVGSETRSVTGGGK